MKARTIHVRSGIFSGLCCRKTGWFSPLRWLPAVFLMPVFLSADPPPAAGPQSDATPASSVQGQPAFSGEAADRGQDWKFVLLASSLLTYDSNIFIRHSNEKSD